MQDIVPALLLALFLAHLVGFSILGVKRREWYYLALVTTFGLLSAAFATLLFAPDVQAGGHALHRLLRFAAWAAAAVSISWTALRVLTRRRAE
ncbi:MAG: hypothetical protein CMP07_09005 [Xanthomonadales bacterium]|nr:hypothetical protein [Xanthomonadales bacterium]|tara:strand:- start:890 stop:1168 length:279 start_codon:yes stop_codon:yes gene_type:complete